VRLSRAGCGEKEVARLRSSEKDFSVAEQSAILRRKK
jgi:hypothetical protein